MTPEDLELLMTAVAGVAQANSAEAVATEAVVGLWSILEPDRAAVALVDGQGSLRVRASSGFSAAGREAIEGWQSAPAGFGAVLPRELRHVMVWPVSEGDRLLALLVVGYDQPFDAPAHQRNLAEMLLAQIRGAFRRIGPAPGGDPGPGGRPALSNSQLQAALAATGEAVLVRGPDERLVWANEAAVRLLGARSFDELLRTPPDEVAARYDVFDAQGARVEPPAFPGRQALHQSQEPRPEGARPEGARPEAERILRYRERATGKERWSVVRAQVLRDEHGEPAGSVTVFRDITARQKALAAQRESERRVAFLASVGPKLLDASLDPRHVLERVAELMVPSLADYCSVREVQADGSLRRLAVRHADPAKAALVEALSAYPVWDTGDDTRNDTAEGMREGRSLLVADIPPEQLAEAGRDDEHRRLLVELAPVSMIAVPVRARGRTIGVIILLLAAGTARRYTPEDLALVEDVAQRAGLAIDNARLYQEEQQARALAEKTGSEVSMLLEVSTLLSSTFDFEAGLHRLARLATERICDLCLADLRNQDGSIRRVAAVSAEPALQPAADALARYAPDPASNHPAARVMRTGTPEFAEVMGEDFMASTTQDAEHHRITRELGFRSYMSVPLAARGHILGALTLVATALSGRQYGPEDLALAADLGRQAALALDNARLYQETDLQKSLLTSQNETALEAVVVVSPEGKIISHNKQMTEMMGMTRDLLESGEPAAVLAWARGLVPEPDAFLERVAHLQAHPGERARDKITLLDGRIMDRWTAPVTGADGTYFGRAWYFRDVTDLKRAEEERGRLYEAERAARMEAETVRARLQFLVEASALLAGSMEIESTLRALAALVVRNLADYCAVDLVVADGSLTRVALAGADPAGQSEMPRDTPAATIIRTRWPLLVPDVADPAAPGRAEPVGVSGVGTVHLGEVFPDTEISSYLGVPLLARGRSLGALSWALAPGSARRYGREDLALAQDLARRVALAVDHASLFDAQRHIAATLQQSLLPPELPAIPGVELAARYRPAITSSEVGGDFYDVFPTGEDTWMLAIGDIAGKGVEAASLTALARYTIRAAAREHHRPTEILNLLNDAILDERHSSRFLTVALGRLRRSHSGLRLTIACGGHPPPLLLRADGAVERAAKPGSLLGFLPGPELTEVVTELRPGDVALFFTDGLTDVRGVGGTFGEERLMELLHNCRGSDAQHTAARLEAEILDFQAGDQRDDLAMLVLKVLPTTSDATVLPAVPAPLRSPHDQSEHPDDQSDDRNNPQDVERKSGAE